MDPKRELLRHILATIAYRGGKAMRGAPETFATFKVSPGSRMPLDILAHMGDLFDWACSTARGAERWQASEPLGWNAEVARFFSSLGDLDRCVASEEPLAVPVEKLVQGPVADALTHVGQLAMLRRIAGAAIRAENYVKADIAIGRVGVEQAVPRREFD
jgi:hypothetical protein